MLLNMIKKRKRYKSVHILLCLTLCLIFSFCLFIYLSSLTSSVPMSDLDSNSEYSKYFLASKNKNKSICLDIYYESLCPDSQSFITNQLDDILRKYKQKPLFHELVEINLIPFGKADVSMIY